MTTSHSVTVEIDAWLDGLTQGDEFRVANDEDESSDTEGTEFKYKKNGAGRVRAVCKHKFCKRFLHASKVRGLIPAMHDLLPYVEHRHCLRRLYNNCKKLHLGEALKERIWRCATTTYKMRFENEIQSLKDLDNSIYKWLAETTNPMHWARCGSWHKLGHNIRTCPGPSSIVQPTENANASVVTTKQGLGVIGKGSYTIFHIPEPFAGSDAAEAGEGTPHCSPFVRFEAPFAGFEAVEIGGGTFNFSTGTRSGPPNGPEVAKTGGGSFSTGTGSEAAETTKTNGSPVSKPVASQKIGHNKKTCPNPQAQAWRKLKSDHPFL
ncbi:hypothetical protein ACH5RR_031976 [Cinchona calisaya]|uniref:Uncharacterized protein n=1 Tax=Cinchona calisaya TaxID=153742 RepID=A0ABD2YGS0_9GENT